MQIQIKPRPLAKPAQDSGLRHIRPATLGTVIRHQLRQAQNGHPDRSAEAEIGIRLAAAMALKGFSAGSLAEASGINRQTIWRYMTGRSTQAFPVIVRLAETLGARLDYLAFGTGRIDKPTRSKPGK